MPPEQSFNCSTEKQLCRLAGLLGCGFNGMLDSESVRIATRDERDARGGKILHDSTVHEKLHDHKHIYAVISTRDKPEIPNCVSCPGAVDSAGWPIFTCDR